MSLIGLFELDSMGTTADSGKGVEGMGPEKRLMHTRATHIETSRFEGSLSTRKRHSRDSVLRLNVHSGGCARENKFK